MILVQFYNDMDIDGPPMCGEWLQLIGFFLGRNGEMTVLKPSDQSVWSVHSPNDFKNGYASGINTTVARLATMRNVGMPECKHLGSLQELYEEKADGLFSITGVTISGFARNALTRTACAEDKCFKAVIDSTHLHNEGAAPCLDRL